MELSVKNYENIAYKIAQQQQNDVHEVTSVE